MARQGNYVSVPGGGANWTKDISGSLQDLSRNLISQAEKEDELARLEADRQYNIGRDVLADQRYDREQALKDKQLAEQQAIIDWTKNYAANFDEAAYRNQLARELGATDEELSGDKGDLFRQAVTLDQDYLLRNAGLDYTKRFGKTFDPSSVAPVVSRFPSFTILQAREDELTKTQQEQHNKAAKYDLDRARVLLSSGLYGFGKGTGGPKSYDDINENEKALAFDTKGSWIPFVGSEASDAQGLIREMKKALEGDKRGGFTPAEANAGIDMALMRLTQGDALTDIDYDLDKAIELARQGALNYRNLGSGVNDATAVRNLLLSAGSRLQEATPIDVRVKAREDALAKFAELRGQGTASSTGSAETQTGAQSQTRAPASNLSELSTSILNRFGINEVLEGSVPTTPVNQPEEVPDQPPTAPTPVNQREKLLGDINAFREAQADMQAAIDDPNTDPRTGFEIRSQMLDMESAIQGREQAIAGIDRYKQETELMSDVRDILGNYVNKDQDTLFVLPRDKKGNSKTWEDIVAEVNSRDILYTSLKDMFTGGSRTITEREALAAADNPILQKKLLDRANTAIAEKAKEVISANTETRAKAEKADKLIERIADTFTNFKGLRSDFSFEPGWRENIEAERLAQAEKSNYQDRVAELLQMVSETRRGNYATTGQAYSGAPDLGLIDVYPEQFIPVLRSLRVGKVGPSNPWPVGPASPAPRSAPRPAVAPKPAPARPVDTTPMGPPKSKYWDNLARRTPASRREPTVGPSKASFQQAQARQRAREIDEALKDAIDPRSFLPRRNTRLDDLELIDPLQFLRR